MIAHPPPFAPERGEVAPKVGGGLLVQVRGEESGNAEEEGFTLKIKAEVAEGAPGNALTEESHGQLVRSVAKGAGERLPEGLLEAVTVFESLQVGGLGGEAKAGGFTEEVVNPGRREVGERVGTTSEAADGAQEVGTGGAVPLTELDDADRLAVGGGELATKGSGEPERLQFEFRGKGGRIVREAAVRLNLGAQFGVRHVPQARCLEKCRKPSKPKQIKSITYLKNPKQPYQKL